MPSAAPLNILLLGSGTSAFLAATRALGRRGHRVFGAWGDAADHEFSTSPEARSRYLVERIPLPSPDHDWLESMLGAIKRRRIDLVIPGDDAALVAIGNHRAHVEAVARVAMPSDAALATLSDKVTSAALARSCAVPVAKGWVVRSVDDLKRATAEITYPVVIKPKVSRQASRPSHRLTVRRADSAESLHVLVRAMLSDGAEVEIQEFFIGRGVGVEVLRCSGQVLLTFQHVRLHEPLTGGGSSYRRGVPVDPRMLGDTMRLLEAVDYDGVAMAEFKWNRADNRYVFIEVNCRFWGAMPLALASGADFPATWVDAMMGRPTKPVNVRSGLQSRRLDADLMWLIGNLRARRSDPTLNTVPIPQVISETLSSVLRGRERFDTFTWDDRGPCWAELRNLLGLFTGKISAAFERRWRRLRLVRHVRRRRLGAAMTTNAKVLVLCKGNICRSPYLAVRLEGLGPSRSVGFLDRPRRPSPDEAIAVALDRGVDLRSHRSAFLTREATDWADVILAFDDEGWAAVRKVAGSDAKLHFAGAALVDRPFIVEDPYGGDSAAFRDCYTHLDAIARALGAPGIPA